MMTDHRIAVPAALRAQIAADYTAVRSLPSPLVRVLAVVPFALLSLFAAQAVFQVRADAPRLGWSGTWGISAAQVLVGLVVIAAALREAIPGRGWTPLGAALWLTLPLVLIVGVTLASWDLSPVPLASRWLLVSGMCLAGSAASALPVAALAGVLAARAYATRPFFAGALAGLGAGLTADAGWRLFCHFSDPAHVFAAHLGGVLVSTAIGAALVVRLSSVGRERRASS